MPRKRRILSLFSFQIGWLTCAMGASRGMPLAGPVAVAALAGLHLLLAADRRWEIRIILAVGAVGTVLDSLQAATGLVTYRNGYPGIDWLCPLWITAMWVNFAVMLNSGLKWLQGRPLLAGALSAVAGPTNYFTGARMGAIEINADPVPAALLMGVIWGLTVPFLLWLVQRLRPERTAGSAE